MSFKDYDKKTYIADLARDFAARRISQARLPARRSAWPASASRPSTQAFSATPAASAATLALSAREAMAQDAEPSPSG